MAVAASLDCLKGISPREVEGLYFATTTAPYREKQSAAIVASAVDLPRECHTADFGNSLRSGAIAMGGAINAIKGGAAKSVLVAAADCRLSMAQGDLEQLVGDGAAALLMGDSGVIASVEGGYSVFNEFLDLWRAEGDPFVRSWEDRFIVSEGYINTTREAVSGLMKKHGLTPQDFAKVVIYGQDARSHAALTRGLGFDPRTQVQDPLIATVGNSGTASALMMLVAALEEAKPGDRILFASYGDGCDAYILQVTPEIEKLGYRRGVKNHLPVKKQLANYERYLEWRRLLTVPSPPGRHEFETPSSVALWREHRRVFPLYGTKCQRCGTPQFPPQRVCAACQAVDEFEDYKFSDKQAQVFTYCGDNVTPTTSPPIIQAVIDFQGGGRSGCFITDCDLGDVEIGMMVEMTFRRLYQAEPEQGISNYYWKCRPVRYEG
jgi:3-hydroxy-3-methylglutaryl CoA synthase